MSGAFSLRRFHDRLLGFEAVLPSLVRWECFGDPRWIERAAMEPISPQFP